MIQLTEEQRMIQEMVRKLVKEKVAPKASEIDEKGEFPEDIAELFGEYGFLRLCLPQKYGGIDASPTTLALVIEETSRGCASSASMIFTTQAVLAVLRETGDASQKERFFRFCSEGNRLGSFALTEPNYGSNAGSLQSRALRDGDLYRVNGTKVFVTTGGASDLYLVFLRTSLEKRKEGISAFIVEKGTPGFSFGKRENKMGLRGSLTVELIFQDALVPARNLLLGEGKGWEILTRYANPMRAWGAGAMALGIAEGAFDIARAYTQERVQFGRRLIQIQTIQFMLADMAILIEAARSLIYRTTALLESRSTPFHGLDSLVSISKCFASDMAQKVTTDAVQLLGAYGYMKDYPVERMMRDAKATQIFDGTNQVQRMVISRHLLKGFP